MIDNPYQSPNANFTESAVTQHRSFRLTQNSPSSDASVTAGTFRDAIRFSLVQQVPLLLVSLLILDGGLIFKRVGIASVGFWILTLIIMIRRGRNMPDSDILLIKWAYLPLLLATSILWIVALAILF